VSNNSVSGFSATGILVEAESKNVFSSNHIAGSAVHDGQDQTTLTTTFGTANNWHGNKGKSSNSSPAGIC